TDAPRFRDRRRAGSGSGRRVAGPSRARRARRRERAGTALVRPVGFARLPMPTPQDRPPPNRVRRVPPRRGFRRVVAILLVMFAMDLAWRAGAFAHLARASDRSLVAGAPGPLSGPPVVARAQ